jgi:ABC-type Fe3+/spermidine/putrescine transport system ATPase subunit
MADRIAVMDGGRIQQYAPPREIYESPANAFVAGFIGESNFIDGHAETTGGRTVFHVQGSDQTVKLEGGSLVKGRARLAIRPELIRIGEVRGARMTGTVEEVIYGGGSVACHVRVGADTVVMARIPATEAGGIARGTLAGLHWAGDHAKVFPQ